MTDLEFLSFTTTDNLVLPGLLYTPKTQTKKAAIWLHGMGDSAVFYKPDLTNALGRALAEQGIALLAFNNRGAHNVKTIKSADDVTIEGDRFQGGTFYELIADCSRDVDGAVALLKQRGYSEFYLLGHSTGANKICVYQAQAVDNPFSKYVLAGPGDDVGLWFNDLGEKKFWTALKYAAAHVKTEPLRTMPKYTGMYPFSVQSTHDILNPDGAYNTFPFYECTTERLGKKRLFDEYQAITMPTLVIFGAEDEYAVTAGSVKKALDLFMQYTSNSMLKKNDFNTVTGADHSFHGVEAVFAQQVADWLGND